MIRLDELARRIGLIAVPIVSIACVGTRLPQASDRHARLDEAPFASVVAIAGREVGTGSGTVVGPGLVLTAQHVVEGLLESSGSMEGWFVGSGRGTPHVLANGIVDEPHGDWALLRVDEALVAERPAMPLHAAAREPDWEPEPGLEVFVVGYGNAFFEDEIVRPWLPPARLVRTVGELPEPTDDPEHVPVGWALDDDGRRELSGMSGGPVLVWSEEHARLEQIGVFIATDAFRRRLETPLFDLTLDEEDFLLFVRLPAALEAYLPRDGGRPRAPAP